MQVYGWAAVVSGSPDNLEAGALLAVTDAILFGRLEVFAVSNLVVFQCLGGKFEAYSNANGTLEGKKCLQGRFSLKTGALLTMSNADLVTLCCLFYQRSALVSHSPKMVKSLLQLFLYSVG